MFLYIFFVWYRCKCKGCSNEYGKNLTIIQPLKRKASSIKQNLPNHSGKLRRTDAQDIMDSFGIKVSESAWYMVESCTIALMSKSTDLCLPDNIKELSEMYNIFSTSFPDLHLRTKSLNMVKCKLKMVADYQNIYGEKEETSGNKPNETAASNNNVVAATKVDKPKVKKKKVDKKKVDKKKVNKKKVDEKKVTNAELAKKCKKLAQPRSSSRAHKPKQTFDM